MSDADIKSIELAVRIPLPASTSTVFISSPENDGIQSNHGSVPQPDTGFRAWSFLLAAFFVEGIVWGFPNAFGVFLESYLQDPYFANQPRANTLLPLIGTLSSGIIYCSGPIILRFMNGYPHHRRACLWVGALVACASLLGASFATTINQLIALQGVLYAIGGVLVYLPAVSYLTEWFVARRGLASGILFAGSAVGGLIVPLALPPLLSHFGAAKTLRIFSIVVAVTLFPLLPFVKSRIPEVRTRVRGPAPRGTGNEWKSPLFWVLIATNTLQSFAYFLPLIWLPTFASDLNLSKGNAALTLALLNGASVLGMISIGWLSDKINAWLLASINLALTSLATFILWGVLSNTFGGLIAFGIAYGTLAGAFSVLWTAFIKPIAKDDQWMTMSIFGYLALSRGIGNICSTPISSVLSKGGATNVHHYSTGFQVGDRRFENMIIYVGTCFAAAAAVAIIGWRIDGRKSGRDGTVLQK